MKITNQDIADKLGISRTAVSLAINNKPGVSEETRQKVLELYKQKFEGNSSLLQEKSPFNGTILMAVHKKHGMVINDKPFFSDLIETVQQEAMLNDYSMSILHYVPGQDLKKYRSMLYAQNVNGVIVMATEMDKEDLNIYKELGKPLVLLDGSFDLEEVDSVALDNQTAIYRAFAYAVGMGHRDIGFLQSETYINNFGHHFDGFNKGIRDFSLEGAYHPVIKLPCVIDGAYKKMKEFLRENKNYKMPTLFLADLDYIALGAMQALKEAGYKVPEDISFIGYDDVQMCEVSEPPLTTTRVNKKDVGKLAVRRLLEIMDGPKNYYTTTQVSSKLIIRKSVRKI